MEVVVATEDEQFEIAATLRATAFYDDLLERGEMPFPARFTATFHRGRAARAKGASGTDDEKGWTGVGVDVLHGGVRGDGVSGMSRRERAGRAVRESD